MENATKALLIAASILLIIMVLSAVMIFWDEMAGYFSQKHEATMLEQLVEFNNKFSSYNGKTIRGNELVSIMNRIIDYNEYQSELQGYDRIAIRIDLKGHHEELKYDGETGNNTIIKGSTITNTGIDKDKPIKDIAETSSRLSTELGMSDVELQKLVQNISNIVSDESVASEIKQAVYQYNQFTQFKRAVFKCTNINYNQQNGRINEMIFEVVLETDFSGEHIKFD